MSRDLTPRELDIIQKELDLENITSNLVIKYGDIEVPAYTEEQQELSKSYPKLGMCGFDFLSMCKEKGILSTKLGKILIDEVEQVISGGDITYKEYKETILEWYDGELEPGYSMENNNIALVEYIENMIYHLEPDTELND